MLAGPNGAGKSTVLGAAVGAAQLEFYNPDVAAAKVRRQHPEVGQEQANSFAWQVMRDHLAAAAKDHETYAFETTLGGKTITSLLSGAVDDGMDVYVWYIGLDSADHCISRVRARVAAGGHDIPEDRVRERYDSSRANLARLAPELKLLKVFDNSEDGEPDPKLLLHAVNGYLVNIRDPVTLPEWVKPIVGSMI